METVPHIVLEYDKWSDCALVALTDDAHSDVRGGTDMPYLVTSGYHRGSRTWARATPFGDITRVKVREQERDISPYLRQIAQRCQRISHPIDPPETAAAAARATFGGAAARPAYRGHKNQ